MQFAGLNYVFIRAIMYTGGGGRGKEKTVPDVFITRQGSYSRPRTQFFFTITTFLDCYIIFFSLSWNCSFEFGKRNRKEEYRAYKISCRFVKGFFVWCKILFFALPILV